MIPARYWMPKEQQRIVRKRLSFWKTQRERTIQRKFKAIPFGSLGSSDIQQQLSYQSELILLNQLIENCQQLLKLHESVSSLSW